jgi:hypothetical protein
MSRSLCRIALAFLFLIPLNVSAQEAQAQAGPPGRLADKPLFRDPIHDGAADPVVVYNRERASWFMFYTNRRANVEGLSGVTWVHGTEIGIAESTDGGASWSYVGTANIPIGGDEYSYWAPDVLEHDGTYHMYLTYVPGIFENWSHPRTIYHLTSRNLLDWEVESELELANRKVIDAHVMPLPGGGWRMWYNNEVDGKSIWYADSPDLYEWTDRGLAMGDRRGEGPVVFTWRGTTWMIVDVWEGVAVFHSDDLETWHRQETDLLGEPGTGLDDQVIGRHPGVAVVGDRAFLFYFTHPGHHMAARGGSGYAARRSSIQVVELHEEDGVLTADRNAPTYIDLESPDAGARTR